MVKSKSNSRLFNIKNLVILAQTDTTVGFASQNQKKLTDIKLRPNSKPFIIIYNSLLACEIRVPKSKKNLVRRCKKTTFIVKNKAFRINSNFPEQSYKYSCATKNSQILRDLTSYYSTSANEKDKNFDLEFCESKADIIIEDKNGLHENSSSTLLKINNIKKMRIR